jgi:hypothetical protein
LPRKLPHCSLGIPACISSERPDFQISSLVILSGSFSVRPGASAPTGMAEAHRNGSRCLWEVSLGWDCGQRDKTLREAVSCGRLAHDAAAPFLVAPKESGCPDEGLAQSMPLRLASGTARSAAPQRSAAGWIESIRQTLAESVEKKKARREQAALRERERVDELKSASRAAAAAALRER